jgi:signal transduction histidine kinase
VNPLRTVGGRLALALLLVVAGALAIVYVVVVPSYERSLVNSPLADLDHTLRSITELPRAPGASLNQAWVEDEAAPLANARVVVFHYACCPTLLLPVADSNGGSSRDVGNDPIAVRALRRHGTVRGTVERNHESYAEAALADEKQGAIVLLSSSLHNDLQSVGVVQRRVIVAGALATVFAILLGYTLATLFARRIRRLERAAEGIAGGRFDEAVVDAAPDELGQLARAFERMRLQLASLDRARRDFIANASHELRTPLFSVGGFLELLASEELDADTRAEFLNETREQVSRLQKLATDLLDLSRLDAGRLAVARESFDLATLGDLLTTEFGPRAAAADHRLALEVRSAAYAFGDEERVLQVARVLVDNALVHTLPGSTVTIVVEGDNRVGGTARLSVVDDGAGIPSDAQAHVFDRFFRIEGTVAAGSGLGLAIAREVAGLMDGRVELVSRPGETRFTLVLPADAFGHPPTAGTLRSEEEEAPRRGSGRIAQV